MEFLISGLPATVALAVVAAIAYLFGRRNRDSDDEAQRELRRETKRAQAIVREMEQVAQQIRRGLAAHHTNVLQFKDRIAELSRSPRDDVGQRLCLEAERMLKPTMRLAAQVARAYDEIRQQTTDLMAFTEVRTDPLTGLGNRRTLDESLSKLTALKTRYQTPFALAIFDIDRFKSINDEHGHVFGDRVLQTVARAFDDFIRDTDTVVRYGGEEFVVVLPAIGLDEACLFAERMRTAIQASDEIPVTISGGVAAALPADAPRTLLSRADSALYSAKAAGRNRVFRHTGEHIEPVEPQTVPSRQPETEGAGAASNGMNTARPAAATQVGQALLPVANLTGESAHPSERAADSQTPRVGCADGTPPLPLPPNAIPSLPMSTIQGHSPG